MKWDQSQISFLHQLTVGIKGVVRVVVALDPILGVKDPVSGLSTVSATRAVAVQIIIVLGNLRSVFKDSGYFFWKGWEVFWLQAILLMTL